MNYFDRMIDQTLLLEDCNALNGKARLEHLGDGKKNTFIGIVDEDDAHLLPAFLEGTVVNLYKYYQEHREDALEIIRELFYNGYYNKLYNDIPSYKIVSKLFDMGLPCGVGTAVRLMQSVLNDMGASLSEDGSFGPKTLSSINAFLAEGKEDIMYNRYLKKHEERFKSLKQFDKFGDGWLNRLNYEFK